MSEKIYESPNNPNAIDFINESYKTNSSFIQFFLNNKQISSGSFYELPYGIVGIPEKDGQNYEVIYSTKNTTLLGLEEKIGITCPREVLIKNINESMLPKHDSYYLNIDPNQFDYDYSGDINILVRAFLTGNNSFLNDIFQTEGLRYSVGFMIFLVATNVGLKPIDYFHYITQFLPLLPPIWIFSLLVLYLVIRNARKRLGRNDA
ncbi:hypothetical protein ACNF42_03945 [Cuniculiplasma sp. SKW3]|uniref:hypothetical protein n=1 Tax=Cuniculiplasma sp. SKW3 TaxID=3400170 RepID=UPI003FD048E7